MIAEAVRPARPAEGAIGLVRVGRLPTKLVPQAWCRLWLVGHIPTYLESTTRVLLSGGCDSFGQLCSRDSA